MTVPKKAEDLRSPGRKLNRVTEQLLKGKKVKVPWGVDHPDKTLKAYGLRLRSKKNPDGTGHILWAEDL